MKLWLTLAAGLEAMTGLALIAMPLVVVRLLLGEGASAEACIPIGRVAGFGLFSLGVGCWPGRDGGGSSASALRAMLIYNLLVAIYFIWLGIGGKWVGPLLWPAVILHAGMAAWRIMALMEKSGRGNVGMARGVEEPR